MTRFGICKISLVSVNNHWTKMNKIWKKWRNWFRENGCKSMPQTRQWIIRMVITCSMHLPACPSPLALSSIPLWSNAQTYRPINCTCLFVCLFFPPKNIHPLYYQQHKIRNAKVQWPRHLRLRSVVFLFKSNITWFFENSKFPKCNIKLINCCITTNAAH